MIDSSVSLSDLNQKSLIGMGIYIGMEFIEVTPEFLKSRMKVDSRTSQPLGMLNGGASAAMAEITGSMASYLSVDRDKYYCLGLEIKCNHISTVSSGYVYATAKPIHIGKRTHVIQIEITTEEGKIVSFSTHTTAVLELTEEMKIELKDLFL